jgi:ABC-type transporter Mla subunit MlaD
MSLGLALRSRLGAGSLGKGIGMEADVLNILIKAGELVVLCLVILQLARNQGQSNTAVTSLAAALTQLTETLDASTQALGDLKKCEDETQTLMAGMRREVQGAQADQMQAHAAQTTALDALKEAVAALPEKTAEGVQTKLGPELSAIRQKLEQAALSIGAACTKLDLLAKEPETSSQGPGEASQDPVPEKSEEIVKEETL